ncbi:flagellar export ATPase [Micractinium conductrix]|uniref:Flagellar export ATPase n=1 Tax=Micractinium conductrix TaxID=554055 RepID=A0A2P6VDT0_9CHLO|nr:flagellar export ATPase [Micractinium conductrix]|eukprot:PSC72229.1 flagellar export ATPase [Micractinium conductrix]
MDGLKAKRFRGFVDWLRWHVPGCTEVLTLRRRLAREEDSGEDSEDDSGEESEEESWEEAARSGRRAAHSLTALLAAACAAGSLQRVDIDLGGLRDLEVHMEAWAPLARGSLRILRVQVDCLTLAGRLDQCTALEELTAMSVASALPVDPACRLPPSLTWLELGTMAVVAQPQVLPVRLLQPLTQLRTLALHGPLRTQLDVVSLLVVNCPSLRCLALALDTESFALFQAPFPYAGVHRRTVRYDSDEELLASTEELFLSEGTTL